MSTAHNAFKWVGSRPVRPDGLEKVTGSAKYGADFTLPGALFGKVLRSPHPHARILSIDTARAAAMPGVKAVITGAGRFSLALFGSRHHCRPDRKSLGPSA